MLNVRRYIHLHCPLNIGGVQISYIRFEMKQADTNSIGLLTLSIIKRYSPPPIVLYLLTSLSHNHIAKQNNVLSVEKHNLDNAKCKKVTWFENSSDVI